MAVLFFAVLPIRVQGQAAWEYTPYQARVWVALDARPQLPGSLIASVADEVTARANTTWGAVLQMQVSEAPQKLRGMLLNDLDQVSVEALTTTATADDLAADKIFLAAIRAGKNDLVVRVRELDCKTRQLGPVVERSCGRVSGLSRALCDAVADSFTPVARIEQVEDRKLVARLRAGGLIVDPTSPALLEPGMVLRPVIRRNDRNGQPVKGGIQPVPWSFLSIEERRDAVLECTLRSGYRSAIPAKGGVRMERLALAVRPRFEETNLSLRSRTDTSKTLADYEIHRRLPESEETELVGTTDGRGQIRLPRGDGSLETLVVKNGKQLLARLPVVPGYEKALTAHVIDDDPRLAAEGFVAALHSRALDLVARREILAARIRARIKEGKSDEAQKLLEEFRRLDTRADLSRDLDRFRQQVSAVDKVTEQRIDRIFTEAQRLFLLKPLSDELLAQLTREVSADRPGGE